MIFKTITDETGKTKTNVTEIAAAAKNLGSNLFSKITHKTSENIISTKPFEYDSDFSKSLSVDKHSLEEYMTAVGQGESKLEQLTLGFKNASVAAKEFAQAHLSKVSDKMSETQISSMLSEFESGQKSAQIELMATDKSYGNTATLIEEYNNILNDSVHAQEENYVATSKSGLTQEQYLEALNKSNPKLANYLSLTKDGTASTTGYTRSLVAMTAQTVWATVKTMALNAAISMGVSLLLSGITYLASTLISTIKEAVEEPEKAISRLNDELKDLQSDINSTANEFADLKTQTDKIIPDFVELAKGVDRFGNNVGGLTEDEYAKFWELNNKLAELFPELDNGLDSNGNHILALSYNASTLTDSLNELIKSYESAANIKMAESLPDVLENISKADNKYDQQIASMEQAKNSLQQLQALYNSNPSIAEGDLSGMRRYLATVQGAAKFAGLDSVLFFANTLSDVLYKNPLDIGKYLNGNEFNNIIDGIDRKMSSIAENQTARWKNLSSTMSAWIKTTDDYGQLDSDFQQMLSNIIGNIDYSKIGITNASDLKSYIQTNFISPLREVTPEVQSEISNLFNVNDGFNNGESSVVEYLNTMYEELGKLKSLGLSDELTSALGSLFSVNEIEQQIRAIDTALWGEKSAIDDFVMHLSKEDIQILYQIIAKEGSLTIENAIEEVKEFKKVAEGESQATLFIKAITDTSSITDNLEYIDKIYSDILNGDDFDYSALISDDFKKKFGNLGDVYNDFIKTIASSPNDIDNCREAFNQLTSAYINNSGVLAQITDENKDVITAMLKQSGVANAAAIVDERLAVAKEKLRLESEGFQNSTAAEVSSILETASASEITKQAMAELWLTKTEINSNTIKSSEDVKNLLAIANAAGATTASIEQLNRALILISEAESNESRAAAEGSKTGTLYQRTASGLREIAARKRREAAALLDQKVEFSGYTDYVGGSNSNKARTDASKAAGKAATQTKTWFEEQLAYHQHLVAMEKETDAQYYTWLESAYQKAYGQGVIELDDYRKYQEEVFNGLKTLFKDNLNDIEHEISMRKEYDNENKKIISLYKTLISSVENEIAKARKRGLTDSDDYIQELLDKWVSYKNSIKDIEDELKNNAKDAIDSLVDYQQDIIKQNIENEKDALNTRLDNLKDFYDKQKEMLQDQKDEEDYLRDQSEKRKSVSDIQNQLAQLEPDNSAWGQKRKAELNKELKDAQDELNQFEKDHALDMALDALDEAYNSQEAQIQKQIEALDDELNNPELMFNKALLAIQQNTGNLYQQMLEYNRKYGTGNDADVKDTYEEAYKALLEYRQLYGKDYDGVTLKNATGYKQNLNSGYTTSNKSSSGSTSSSKPSTSSSTSSSSSSAPALKAGSSVTVKKTATHFSSRSKNVKMASFVPGGKYTVYQTKGNEVLIGRNGVYTGWINKSDIVGYASGTGSATAGIHKIDELGSETIFESKDGARYKLFSGGEKVLNANASNFLYNFANSGGEILKTIIRGVVEGKSLSGLSPAISNTEVNMGDIIIQGNTDKQTVSEIRRAQRSSMETMLKELNRLNK